MAFDADSRSDNNFFKEFPGRSAHYSENGKMIVPQAIFIKEFTKKENSELFLSIPSYFSSFSPESDSEETYFYLEKTDLYPFVATAYQKRMYVKTEMEEGSTRLRSPKCYYPKWTL